MSGHEFKGYCLAKDRHHVCKLEIDHEGCHHNRLGLAHTWPADETMQSRSWRHNHEKRQATLRKRASKRVGIQ